jgi:hypothetical protein
MNLAEIKVEEFFVEFLFSKASGFRGQGVMEKERFGSERVLWER